MKQQSEYEIQRDYFKWVRSNHRLHDAFELIHHIPNGSTFSIGHTQKLKHMGLVSGMPDVFIPWVMTKSFRGGCYLEFKTPKGKVSKAQQAVHEELEDRCYEVYVVRSVVEAIEATVKYLEIEGVDTYTGK